MKVGYVRVSTPKQIKDHSIPIQRKALKAQNCNPIYVEQYSGHSYNRPKLHKALDELKQASHIHLIEAKSSYKESHNNSLHGFKYQPKDELVVYKLDRLARNMRDGLNIIHQLINEHVKVLILQPSRMTVDTSTIQGKMMLDMLLMFADIERDMIKDRMMNGRVGEHGKGGRPTRLHGKHAMTYKHLYNDYVNDINTRNKFPKNWAEDVGKSPAEHVASEYHMTRQNVYRIYNRLKHVSFHGKKLLYKTKRN